MSMKPISTEVAVKKQKDGVVVSFDYSPAAAKRMARIKGAEFDSDRGGWFVPGATAKDEAIVNAVADVKQALTSDVAGLDAVERAARSEARSMLVKLARPSADIVVSNFRDQGRTYSGEIIAANGEYAAQLNGFDEGKNTQYVSVHRQADFKQALFKGDRVRLSYEGAKGVAEDLPPDFHQTLGRSSEGVKVVKTEKAFEVSFQFDPDMVARLNRVDGAHYDMGNNVTTVPLDKEQWLVPAVNDMRRIHKEVRASAQEMQSLAEGKIQDAEVRDARRDGRPDSGEIVAKNDTHVLQHTGRNFFSLHRVSAFNQEPPAVGKSVKIGYEKGRASVSEGQGRGQGHGR